MWVIVDSHPETRVNEHGAKMLMAPEIFVPWSHESRQAWGWTGPLPKGNMQSTALTLLFPRISSPRIVIYITDIRQVEGGPGIIRLQHPLANLDSISLSFLFLLLLFLVDGLQNNAELLSLPRYRSIPARLEIPSELGVFPPSPFENSQKERNNRVVYQLPCCSMDFLNRKNMFKST